MDKSTSNCEFRIVNCELRSSHPKSEIRNLQSDFREWLETDGLGGFASGTVCGIRTRRYHALLLSATQPPTGRMVLVNGLEVWVQTPEGSFALSSHRYAPDVIFPDGVRHIEQFQTDPWPQWMFRLPDGTRLLQELFVPRSTPQVVIAWRLLSRQSDITLTVRPLLSGRDYHALHRENSSIRWDARIDGHRVLWQLYDGIPSVMASTNGTYAHEPLWYRDFLYEEERARGLDCVEDLAAPGQFQWDLSRSEAVLLLTTPQDGTTPSGVSAFAQLKRLRASEHRRRKAFASRIDRSADAYLVKRDAGTTILAGYPWFTDWGRDTFIALRGLCLATERFEEARQILLEWAGTISEGMVPNRFPDDHTTPAYNSVDASLWYIIAVDAFFKAMDAAGRDVAPRDRTTLHAAIEAILTGYVKGTRYRIHLDTDGLLACGEAGVQLTWMDVKIGEWIVTPRIGKPIEVQALWLNALWIGSAWSGRWSQLFTKGREAFQSKCWNSAANALYDVIDIDHQPGVCDGTFRPNQIFAVGGLPLMLLDGGRARCVLEAIEARLLTPMGLRSLAPGEPGYAPRYEGGPVERDRAYHQGTVWPWLMGPFVEAWVRVRGRTSEALRDARLRFLEPWRQHLDEAGIGHLSEITDAEAPYTPRGCPFQAWSLAEMLRLDRVVLSSRRGSGRALLKRPRITAKTRRVALVR